MTASRIESLPEFPAIIELRRALWRTGDLRGAAVFVGAGFSRNAVRPSPDSAHAPTWAELVSSMQAELGHVRSEVRADPLQVAQQYEAMFGRQALDSLIRRLIPDESLAPGPLHTRLMRLPWTDVLTTNFDSLIERAAIHSAQQTFEVVHDSRDIARTRSPRVVKLHGSMPSGPFIITAEDYRTYPRRCAPMVNLVQQVLLENHLVLLGFSATDPNFVAWTGWVRDHLGAAARRLYLVGLLDLSVAARRVLEQQGVVVIDLTPAVETVDPAEQHIRALEELMGVLEAGKPPKLDAWNLKKPPADVMGPVPHAPSDQDQKPQGPQHWFKVDAAAQRIRTRVDDWADDRKNYPGWVVAPHRHRELLRYRLSGDAPNIKPAILSLPSHERSRALYEFAWRLSTALLDPPIWLLDQISATILGSEKTGLNRREQFESALFVLKAARESRDGDRFAKCSSWIAANPIDDQDMTAASRYETALWLRDGIELRKLGDAIDQIGGTDPIFKLRRAALWAKVGAFRNSYNLVQSALVELRERGMRDRHSIWIVSRYGWALYLARQMRWSLSISEAMEPNGKGDDEIEFLESRELSELSCNPSDEFDAIERELSRIEREAAEARIDMSPRFDSGSYTVRRRLGGEREPAATVLGDETTRIADCVGLPEDFDHTSINRGRVDRSLLITEPVSGEHLLQLCALIDRREGKVIERFLNRVAVAALELETVESVLASVLAAIDDIQPLIDPTESNGSGRSGDYLNERITVFLEIASRLVIRVDAPSAMAVVQRAFAWARDSRWVHEWKSESLSNLFSRSIEALPQRGHAQLLEDIAHHPLPGEKGARGHLANYWPEPSVYIDRETPCSRPAGMQFSARIQALLDATSLGANLDRERAILRLALFVRLGCLTDEELRKFAHALWSRVDVDGLPTACTLRSFALLAMPEPELGKAERSLRSAYFARNKQILLTPQLVDLLSTEKAGSEDGASYLHLEPDEALRCLDAIIAYKQEGPVHVLTSSRDDRVHVHLGYALAVGVLPFLEEDQIGEQRLEALGQRLSQALSPTILPCAPQLVRISSGRLTEASDVLCRAMVSDESDLVGPALWAVERWRLLARRGKLVPLPDLIVRNLMSLLATRHFVGLSGALHIAVKLFEDNALDDVDLQRILLCLDFLIEETKNLAREPDAQAASMRAGIMPLVRKEAARAALRLSALGIQSPTIDRWREIIPIDPYPEVRSTLKQ